MSLPPLQWLNLNQLWAVGGAQPPPLRDAHLSYDPAKRVLVLYGGESSAGNPTQQTYILQMDDLAWRTPVPPDAQQGIPPARSAGAFGLDSASNYRNGLLVWGGKGSTDTPLDDLWYYHFQNEFWDRIPINSTTNPLARWGSASGTAPQSSIQNVETFLWIAGGVNATGAFPLGEVWQLDVTGVVAAGSNAASGSWSQVQNNAQSAGIPQSARYGAAGTAVPPVGNANREGTLVVFGGCDLSSTANYSASCGQNDAEILTLPTDPSQTAAQWTIAADCPPGSYAASMGPNRNTATTTFSSQVFLFPAAVDTSLWNDTVSALDGEIGILESTSGVWARVLPAGDPKSTPSRPTPKEGATIYSYTSSITGQAGDWSDTIIFGGKDVATGQLTNEMWILRAYNDVVQSSSQQWSGYGNGELESGVNATGTGVTIQFLSSCAQRLSSTASPGPTTTGGSPSGSTSLPNPSAAPANSDNLFDHSPVNQYLSPLSIGLLLPAIILFRASSSSAASPLLAKHATIFRSASGFIFVAAYVVGITGFALGAKHNKGHQTVTMRRRSTNTSMDHSFVPTAHGKAALALFIVLYILLPIWAVVLIMTCRRPVRLKGSVSRPGLQEHRKDADETTAQATSLLSPPEKDGRRRRSPSEDGSAIMLHEKGTRRISSEYSPPATEGEGGDDFPSRARAQSPKSNGLFSNAISSYRARGLSDNTVLPTTPPSPPPTPTKFEVVNRQVKTNSHHASQPSLSGSTHVSRNPSDISWLAQRRSVGMYGQLDYELSHRVNGPAKTPSPGAPSEIQPTTTAFTAQTPPTLPRRRARLWFNIALQAVTLWALLFWLITFSITGSAAGLAVMATCLVLFYTGLVGLAWMKRPHDSILVVAVFRLHGDPTQASTSTQPPLQSSMGPRLQQPSGSHPYMHSPPFRAIQGAEDDVFSRSTHGARSMESEAMEDEDEDEDTRQARIEEEMARRDVSIFTVPKRRLVVRN
ncbi:hypothetical protein FRB96_000167 [Tulasnella sp. 330]|nr:hypothetical protein FRB96_000167 [Tulasnella sp. 330]